jgi:hypothetical protein
MDASAKDPLVGQLQRGHAARAAQTYTAAADHYLLPALGFWDRWGVATVTRLPLSAGDVVLDVLRRRGIRAPRRAGGRSDRECARPRPC